MQKYKIESARMACLVIMIASVLWTNCKEAFQNYQHNHSYPGDKISLNYMVSIHRRDAQKDTIKRKDCHVVRQIRADFGHNTIQNKILPIFLLHRPPCESAHLINKVMNCSHLIS